MGEFNLKNKRQVGHTILLIEAMPELYEASQQSAFKKILKSIIPLFFEGIEKIILDSFRIFMAIFKVHRPVYLLIGLIASMVKPFIPYVLIAVCTFVVVLEFIFPFL